MITQVTTVQPEWDDAAYDNALVPVENPVSAIAYPEVQGMDWLYKTTRRLSIDNKTRRGFVDKASDSILEQIIVQITSATPLNSHRNPNEGEPGARHEDSVEWCESRNGKHTSTRGYDCRQCPATANCSWKIELTVVMKDQNGEPQEYLLTLPTASSVRFRHTAQALNKRTGKHIEDVLWRGTVTVEENKERRLVYPVANFAPMLPDGTLIDLNKTNTTAPYPAPASQQPPQNPSVNVGTLGTDPVKAGRQNAVNVPGVVKGTSNVPKVVPDGGTYESGIAGLDSLVKTYEFQAANKAFDAETKAKWVKAVQVRASKTMLADEELRHAFVRAHFDDVMTGSMNELSVPQLRALNDWLQRNDAHVYLAGWQKQLTQA
jgi:hypothetical protein